VNKEILLKIAHDAIKCRFDETFKIDKEKLLEEYPFLEEPVACFVNINLNGKLKGCIGSLEAYDMLIDDLISNSYNAAFLDPRFEELSEDESKNIDIEISVLTPALKIEYKDTKDLKSKIKIGKHGVIIERENERFTFLPQVWEQYPTFEEFFKKLIQKGGFENDCIEKGTNILIYEVIKI